MSKKLVSILAATVAAVLLGAAAVLAAGGVINNGGQSDPVKMTVPTFEPIRVKLIGIEVNQVAFLPSDEYAVYPGEPLVLTYEISHAVPRERQAEYVLEVVPTITGQWQQAPMWDLYPSPESQSIVNAVGPAHILLGVGEILKVKLVVFWPRGISINPLPSATIVLNAMRTNCTKVETCPWG